jgi:L-cysteine:1D-myo-inositol 2-amino-2-deoxy-alpha-D-glucopyranoside ligase
MSTRFLGQPVDIHAGGADLCFPHHDAEIAQVEPLEDGEPFVRFWMHTAMVNFEGEKMSKSLGNLVMVSDLLKTFTLDALRLYLGEHHYRTSWSYSQKELARAQEMADRWLKAVQVKGGEDEPLDTSSAWAAFTNSLDDDLDSPGAQSVMEGLADAILEGAMGGRQVEEAQAALRAMGQVFGMRLDAIGPEESVVEGWKRHLKD